MASSVSCLIVVYVLCAAYVVNVNAQPRSIHMPPLQVQPFCRPPWQPVHGQMICLYKSNEKDSWINAAAWCNLIGGHLVEMTNPTIANAVRRMVVVGQNKGKHWIGGSDFESEGTFTWMHSRRPVIPSGFNQISLDVMKNCLNIDDKGAWRDESCTAQFWFICEKILK